VYLLRQKLFAFLIQVFLLSLLCLGVAPSARASVTLISFTATGEPDQVVVEWETGSESDNSGFFVWRSTTENGTYNRVSDFFVSQGNSLVGAVYLWIDDEIVNNTTYWYKLESIDLSQNSLFYGPESATPGVQQPTGTLTLTPTSTQPSPTATSTDPANQTGTPTATATNIIDPTITRTALPVTAAPTRTPSGAYPAPRTNTPVPPAAQQAATQTGLPAPPSPTLPSPTPSPTQVVSATITLIPYPELTLTFPEGGILLPGKATPTQTPPVETPQPSTGWFPSGGILLVVVLVLIWSLLGVWFYLSFQRIQ
jgi:hypothetical protein